MAPSVVIHRRFLKTDHAVRAGDCSPPGNEYERTAP
jgi:hypothetical protein